MKKKFLSVGLGRPCIGLGRRSISSGLLGFLPALLGSPFFCLSVPTLTMAQPAVPADGLKIVLIRHGEKPKKGDNLSCQGLNRSLQLPSVLYADFGIPAAVYIPEMGLGDSTKHARMFQTIIPFAVKYNLALTSKFAEKDSAGIAKELLQKKGVVLVIWEHKCIPSIARALGIQDDSLRWEDDDYDSIWIIDLNHGKAKMTRVKEGLNPSPACPF